MNQVQKFFLDQLNMNESIFYPKSCFQALRNMGCVSEIWDTEKLIPDHGSKKTFGSRIRNTELAFQKKRTNLVNIEALSGLELEIA